MTASSNEPITSEYPLTHDPADAYYLPTMHQSAQQAVAANALANSVEFVPSPVELADTYDRYVSHLYSELTGEVYLDSQLGGRVVQYMDMFQKGEFYTNPGLMVHAMYSLAESVHTANLEHLKYGLFAYCRVTDDTWHQVQNKSFFDDPDKIRTTMPYFFNELLKALHAHVSGRPDAVGGWQEQFYSQEAREAPPAIAMLDFLTAHVRYDLGMALLRTDTQPHHRDDYTRKMNIILTDVANDIVDKYADYPKSVKRLGLDRFGLRLSLYELFHARDEAWNNFETMNGIRDSAAFAQERQNQADRTRRRTVSGMRVARFIFKVMTRLPTGKWDGEDALDPTVGRRRYPVGRGPMAGTDLADMTLREAG